MIKKMVLDILSSGMGQAELAKRIGVSQGRISQITTSTEAKTNNVVYDRLKELHKKVMRRK
jgi:transcriptional regulator with XRE-family HTH domain